MVTKELKAGKKLNLDNFIGLGEYLHRNYYLRDRKLNSRFFLDMLGKAIIDTLNKPLVYANLFSDPSLNRPAIVVVPRGKISQYYYFLYKVIILTMDCNIGEITHLKLTGSKSQLTMGSSNMCVQDKHADRCLITYRERYRREYHEILIKKKTDDTGVTYTFDEVTTSNLYELIVKPSLAEKIFRTYPHMYVAITKEALDLPLDEQPWFVGYLEDDYERKELASGMQLPNLEVDTNLVLLKVLQTRHLFSRTAMKWVIFTCNGLRPTNREATRPRRTLIRSN